jgi:WD40 repeat protein
MIPSGRAEILTGHEDGTLRWTSLADSTSHERWVEAGMRPVVGLVSLAQQSVVVAGGAPGTESLRWWRGPTPLSGQGVAIPHDRLTSMVRWKGHQLVTGGSEGSLQLWTHGKPDGDLLRTDHNTGVWSLITLRGNLVHGPVLLTGGDDGTIRIWASDIRHADPNSQADHESFETGQSRVTKLMENSFGDLISGSSDGTIKVLSPRRIVRAACQHYAPLLNNPNTTPEKEAAQLCTCQIPDSWWEFWSWLCFGWNMFR